MTDPRWAVAASITSALLFAVSPLALAQSTLVDHVDPRLGTGGLPWTSGSVSPAAQLPFGTVQLGPDTAPLFGRGLSNMRTSGYYYLDRRVWGFSHSRMSGTGAADGGLFRVVPRTSRIKGRHRKKGKKTWFLHRNEDAAPGYYSVRLGREDVLVELTATPHVGVHRYTFDANERPRLMIYASSHLSTDGETDESEITIVPGAGEVEGRCRLFDDFTQRQGGLRAYFVAQFDPPFSEWGTWRKDAYDAGSTHDQAQARNESLGAQLGYARSGQRQAITVKVGLSYVSIANARENLLAEAPAGTGFDAVKARATQTWEATLGRAEISGGTADQKEIFYTAHYRSLLMPTQFSDVNGEYPGFDGLTHVANGFTYYTNMSLWDTFRTTHPLFNLVARQEQSDMIVSLTKMAEQGGGYLPRWPCAAGYSNAMLGASADIVISESYQKGVRGFDVNAAYTAMVLGATTEPPAGSKAAGRQEIADYIQRGYCSADTMKDAVSRTLEYAYADDSIGRLASALGRTRDAQRFGLRGKNYQNTFSPQTRYFHPRNADGSFQRAFLPWLLTYLDITSGQRYTNDYVEGSPKQWRWVPFYDAPGLVSLFPSRGEFVSELDDFFAKAIQRRGAPYPGSNYWHGNEPDLHAAYLFVYGARPDLTQKWIRWILETKYATGPRGLDGQDDAGTLSAWYVFSSLGFYPVAGTDRYVIGTPLFGGRIDLGGGRVLEVKVDNGGAANLYVQSVTLGGQPHTTATFTHAQIAGGTTLRFQMGPQPSAWGR
jgi:predicted alpha-1,2-mannosidase